MSDSLALRVLPGRFAVCRLPAGAESPEWAESEAFSSVSRTAEETSVVCEAASVPADVRCDRDWRALMVAGPLDFGLTGVLLSIARPLADAGVSIFAVSTFDTDYVLVKEPVLDTAVRALVAAGHDVEIATGLGS